MDRTNEMRTFGAESGGDPSMKRTAGPVNDYLGDSTLGVSRGVYGKG